MWTSGLSTGIGYRHPILDTLGPISEAGFSEIEVSTAPQHLDLRDPVGLRSLAGRIADLGLRVCSLHAPFGHDVNITSPDAGQRRESLDRLHLAADALAAFQGTYYVIHPGGEDQRWVWEREQRLDLAVEGLREMAEACRVRGLTLVVETPLPHLLGGALDDFAWILERLPREGVGVCVDTSHCALGGFLLDAVARFGDRLVHIQASDNRGVTDDHLPPGDGNIDWGAFCAALQSVGYRGAFMLEVSGNGDIAAHVGRAAQAAARVLSRFARRG
jgi:sugar phosphate isomerase/epimerase